MADLVDQFVRLDAFLMDFIFEATMKLASLTGLKWIMFLHGQNSVYSRYRGYSASSQKQPFCLNFRYPLWESSSEAERGKEREGL